MCQEAVNEFTYRSAVKTEGSFNFYRRKYDFSLNLKINNKSSVPFSFLIYSS